MEKRDTAGLAAVKEEVEVVDRDAVTGEIVKTHRSVHWLNVDTGVEITDPETVAMLEQKAVENAQ